MKRIERRRNLRFHLLAFLLGLIVLGGSWVAIEYVNAGGWPERFSDEGRPGDWNPTVLLILIVWALLLAIHVLNIYYQRQPTASELDREIAGLKTS